MRLSSPCLQHLPLGRAHTPSLAPARSSLGHLPQLCRTVPYREALWMFDVSQHSRLSLSTELGRQQLGDVTLRPPAPAAPPPPIPLPWLPFLGPRGAKQLGDAKSLLSSTGAALDMEVDPGA